MITAIDHLVLTVSDIENTVRFYTDVLGMEVRRFQPQTGGEPRFALYFGAQKINLHAAKAPFTPHAQTPLAGSADLCFLTSWPLTQWQEHLAAHHIDIEEGPVMRSGATHPICSIYIRDPDGNLIEIAQKASDQKASDQKASDKQ